MGENDLLVKLEMQEDKKFSDRANFLLTLQGFLFNAFAAMVGSGKLSGLLLWIPAVLCLAAIALNCLWEATNRLQLKNKIKPLKTELVKRKVLLVGDSNISVFKDIDKETPLRLFDIYRWAPILAAVAWTAVLLIYVLYLTVGINLSI